MKDRIFIGLGSNLGNKLDNIKKALCLMEGKGIHVIRVSTFIETEPYGYLEQDAFVNGVAEVDFPNGTPRQLLDLVLEIEKDMKRERKIHWGPRTIDLDILIWGDKIINDPNLVIPHPDMQNRTFVLDPFAEIAPEIVHPVLGVTIKNIRERIISQ